MYFFNPNGIKFSIKQILSNNPKIIQERSEKQYQNEFLYCSITYKMNFIPFQKYLDSSLNLDLDPIAGLADLLEETDIFPYSQIPNFPMSVSKLNIVYIYLNFSKIHFDSIVFSDRSWSQIKNAFWVIG